MFVVGRIGSVSWERRIENKSQHLCGIRLSASYRGPIFVCNRHDIDFQRMRHEIQKRFGQILSRLSVDLALGIAKRCQHQHSDHDVIDLTNTA